MKNLIVKSPKGKEYNVIVALSDDDKKKGLSNVEGIANNSGMLFVFDKPIKPIMVMKGMNFDLDFVFLSKNNTVLQTSFYEKDFKGKIIPKNNVSAVLELKHGEKDNFTVGEKIELKSSITVEKINGILKFRNGGESLTSSASEAMMLGSVKYDNIIEKDVKIDPTAIQVLDDNGVVLANIKGGNIIFSREDTDDIFKMSISLKTEKEKEELGLRIIEMLDKQKSKGKLYVKN